ncbi:hypothetical protein [Roseateles oligotrophus]|uniref:Uncharacterized protein n=1 Tax=Roseateles oligotrophus TaxID=1769250 RepID=A0ABT2YMK9_9BURK|nr:hypothetical protein [Roseateles oligotrophus]MCV2371304.1 hypothetical protein [Roseateles oligotrophus]
MSIKSPVRRARIRLHFILALGTSCGAAALADSGICAQAAQAIPPRAGQAPTAGEFIAAMADVSDEQREAAIHSELLAGNLPGFLRQARPLHINLMSAGGEQLRLTLCVLADYLSLGSDNDFLRVPMGLNTALAVATSFGFTLPTRAIVDLIYQRSTLRLNPQPMPAGALMRSTAYFVRHNAMVQAQLLSKLRTQREPSADGDAAWLMAGHKKDLVLTPRLWSQTGRVAIYGWHRSIGAPIQPLSTVHGASYADYSHGVRLISKVAYVNGQPRSLFELLANPSLGAWLNDEATRFPNAASLASNLRR